MKALLRIQFRSHSNVACDFFVGKRREVIFIHPDEEFVHHFIADVRAEGTNGLFRLGTEHEFILAAMTARFSLPEKRASPLISAER